MALGRKLSRFLKGNQVSKQIGCGSAAGWYSPEAAFISVWGTAWLADGGTFSCESMAFRGSCHVVV